jgi:hypothetical protein
MSDFLRTVSGFSPNTTSDRVNPKRSTTYLAKVEKVYLDSDTDQSGNPIAPGVCLVKPISTSAQQPLLVYPLDEMFLNIPLQNEIVECFGDSVVPYYRRYNFNVTINNSNTKQAGANSLGNLLNPSQAIKDFKTMALSSNTGIASALNPGGYFKANEKIKRLKIYEGDTIIQSRFGQSIRMSGYNNGSNSFSPTIIIRNKQAEAGLLGGLFAGSDIEEDVNKDGSTIAITSGKYKSDFIPGSPKPLVGTNFKMNPAKGLIPNPILTEKADAFEAYPSSLKGNQILITSDRLIFSSRVEEMIFWSKSHYGVITDGIFSIDTNLGVNINSKGNIDIQTPDKKFTIYNGDTGTILIGNTNTQQAVNGEDLVDVLDDLITAIINLADSGLLTPAGPVSGMKQTTRDEFKELKKNLESRILSKAVRISTGKPPTP